MVGEGQVLGERFRLTRELGRGGMGVVWCALDELLGREVAIKQIRVSPGTSSATETVQRDRMIREARAAARLNHPGAVTVHDVVVAGEDIFIVMELVSAPSLQQLVGEVGPLPVHRVAAIGAGMLEVLCEAHRIGIVHRDVKPPNVMVLAENRVKLADFGIAWLAGDPTLTAAGGVLGSPAYMAPEQIRGDLCTPATDLWALGATLYYAVEGVAAFGAGTPTAAIAAVLTRTPPRPRHAGPELERVLYGLLTKDPARRPPVEWLRAELGRIHSGGHLPQPPPPFTGPAPPGADAARPPVRVLPVRVFGVMWRDYLVGETPEQAVNQALSNFEQPRPTSLTLSSAGNTRFWNGSAFVKRDPFENRTPDPGEYQITWTCQIRAHTELDAIREATILLANSTAPLTFQTLDSNSTHTTVTAELT